MIGIDISLSVSSHFHDFDNYSCRRPLVIIFALDTFDNRITKLLRYLTMDSPFSPQAIGTFAAVATVVAAVGSAIFKGTNAAPVPGGAPVAVGTGVAPVVPRRVTPPTAQPALVPVVGPLPPALALPAVPAGPPPPLYAHPVVAMTMWQSLMMCVDSLVAAIGVTPLNITPLVDSGANGVNGPKVCGESRANIARMSDLARWALITRY